MKKSYQTEPVYFNDQSEFREWLEKNHNKDEATRFSRLSKLIKASEEHNRLF